MSKLPSGDQTGLAQEPPKTSASESELQLSPVLAGEHDVAKGMLQEGVLTSLAQGGNTDSLSLLARASVEPLRQQPEQEQQGAFVPTPRPSDELYSLTRARKRRLDYPEEYKLNEKQTAFADARAAGWTGTGELPGDRDYTPEEQTAIRKKFVQTLDAKRAQDQAAAKEGNSP